VERITDWKAESRRQKAEQRAEGRNVEAKRIYPDTLLMDNVCFDVTNRSRHDILSSTATKDLQVR